MHIAPQIALATCRFDADVTHVHNYHSFPALFAVLGSKEAKIVFTPHYHGRSASAVRDRLLSLYRPVGGWALRRADQVIAVSEWERDRLFEDFDVAASVIPNGLDVERFAGAEPETRDRPYLLCVGRLEEYKGVQHVIRALHQLPEYELVVAGTGPYLDDLEAISDETGVEDRVEFLGYVADERLPDLYAGAAVYLSLSGFEAYGMTIGEALAANTPCVVLQTGALSGWTNRDGVVGVDPVDATDVADAVRSAATRSVTEPVIGWDAVTERVITVYEELVEAPQPN
jgi:glycosyltransferase involved in cell wall biosynthesis